MARVTSVKCRQFVGLPAGRPPDRRARSRARADWLVSPDPSPASVGKGGSQVPGHPRMAGEEGLEAEPRKTQIAIRRRGHRGDARLIAHDREIAEPSRSRPAPQSEGPRVASLDRHNDTASQQDKKLARRVALGKDSAPLGHMPRAHSLRKPNEVRPGNPGKQRQGPQGHSETFTVWRFLGSPLNGSMPCRVCATRCP